MLHILFSVWCVLLICGCSSDSPVNDEVSPQEEQSVAASSSADPLSSGPGGEGTSEPPQRETSGSNPSAEDQEIYYATAEELFNAVQASEYQEAFTELEDFFPLLQGEDTMYAAFVPKDHPNYTVYFYAFYTPELPFHELVYGYLVLNNITEEMHGYFDGDADEYFEQHTLSPEIDFNAYEAMANRRQDI
ncbi:MAG: hypothetical protein D6E12_00505 [Desulfovibrio sp.]|nr:MAG: hypothetical protein D6E12_00505 [Desulfovibrio sp.]